MKELPEFIQVMPIPASLAANSPPAPKDGLPPVGTGVPDRQRPSTRSTNPIRIVHVDDDLIEHTLVRKQLSSLEHLDFEITAIESFPEALACLMGASFDIGLIDYHLGAYDGLKLIGKLGGRLCPTPLVVLTGRGDYSIDVEATNAGAFDYLDKNELTPALLERTIRNVRVQHETEQQLRESESLLRQAKTEAESANRAKSEFLARMSHDLRTPLNAILGFSELIQKQCLGPIGKKKYLSYAGDIHESGQILLSMINDILDLSKVEAGNFELHETDIVIDDLISTVLKLVEPSAGLATLSVRANLGKNLPLLRADLQMVERMLFNLLSNSLKFTPAGGQIVIHAEASEDGLRLTVEDNGIGIAPNKIEQIQEPFAQLSDSLEPSSGTGLGLAIIRTFIEMHGGTLSVKSELGSGTRAILAFPTQRLGDSTASF